MPKIKNMGTATMRFSEGIIVSGSDTGGVAMAVAANVSNEYVVTIDNDQSSAGHVLKLFTDGNGTNTRVLEMEDGDGDTIFRARADGRFGFGPDGVSSMGAGTFVVGIDNSSHTADIAISQRLQHLGDSNTYLDFPSADTFNLVAGGGSFLKYDNSSSKIIINNANENRDTQIMADDGNVVLHVDAGNNRVGIGGSSPISELDVAGKIAITAESTTPLAPNDGQGYLYSKSDGKLYWRSYDLTETDLTATGGGSATPAGADTQIQFNNGGSSFGASSNLTWDDTELKISGTGTSALLNLQTTENSSTASPVLELKRVSSSPADADYLGQVKFIGLNESNSSTTYAKITGKIGDASANTEDGIVEFANIKAGAQTITARLKSDELQLLNNTNLSVEGSGVTDLLFVDAGNDRVGIGTSLPQVTLHVHADSINNGAVTISQSDNSGDASQLDLSKSRGSGASPTTVQDTDFIGQIRMLGYDGNSYDSFADIYAQAAGTISNSSHPSKIVIRTTPPNQTSPVEALTIDDNQNLTVAGGVYGKMIHMTHHRYQDVSGTGKEYIPFAGSTAEQSSPSSIAQGIAPYDGRLVKVMVRSSNNLGLGSTTVGIHKNTDGNTHISSSPVESETSNMLLSNNTKTFTFSQASHFNAGDIIGVSIDPTNSHGNVNVTCVWEYIVTA